MPSNRIAVIGCTKSNVALAESAAAAGFQIVACADSSTQRARQAAKRFESAEAVDPKAPLKETDAVIMAPESGEGGKISDTATAVVATVRGPKRAVMPFDAFDFHPALSALVREIQADKIGKVGFIRVRHTGNRDSLAPALRATLNALLQMATHPVQAFGQVAERGKRASQLIVTLTLADGAIAQLNFSEQRGVKPRLEMEVIGTEGLLAIDSHDEVLAGHLYDNAAANWFEGRRTQVYWQLVADAIADDSHPFRVDVTRAKRIQRIVKRIEKSVATFQAVRIKEPKP